MLKVFIISLKHDIDKRNRICTTLDAMSIEYEIIDGVYGKNLQAKYINALNQQGILCKRGYLATPGEIGCSLSHNLAIKRILVDKIGWACILEDDAILDSRFKDFVMNFDETSHNPNDLYLLGGQEGLRTRRLISKSVYYKKNIGNQIFNRVMYSNKYITRACAYVISFDSSQKYISHYESNFYLTDDWDYLIENNIFEKIYFSDFVAHPIDLKDSNLESERLNAFANTVGYKKTYYYKLLSNAVYLIKIFLSSIKKYIP